MDKITAEEIIKKLSGTYPSKPALEYSTPYELLVAVILSAQCTDKRVNEVTRTLFRDYGTPEKMAQLTEEQLSEKIYSCGLYRNKAKNIIKTTKTLLERYGGEVPGDLERLRALDGVGRKTANVVYSVAFKGNAIAVDTHVFRVSNRIGLADSASVLKTEYQLNEILPKDKWSEAHHYLIYLGRDKCTASASPKCETCVINQLCEKRIKSGRRERKKDGSTE